MKKPTVKPPRACLRDFAASLPDRSVVWLSSSFVDFDALRRAFRPRRLVMAQTPAGSAPYLTHAQWAAWIAELRAGAAAGTVACIHHGFPVFGGAMNAPGMVASRPAPFDAWLSCEQDEFPTREDGHAHAWTVFAARDVRVLGSLRWRRDEAVDEATGQVYGRSGTLRAPRATR